MLEKFKYFGVRFIYYRIKRHFPYLQDKSKDVLSQKILSRAISKKIIREYGGLIGHGATEREEPFLGLGLIHYSMIRNVKPELAL